MAIGYAEDRMSSEAEDILRLKRCPECGYDLRGLPTAHQCPECGRAYDGSIIDIPAWRPLGSDVPLGSMEVLLFASIFLGFPIVCRFVLRMPIPCSVVVGIGVVLLVPTVLRLRRWKKGIPEIVLMLKEDGLTVGPPGSRRPLFLPWSGLRSVGVGRGRQGRWRLIIKRRYPAALFYRGVDVRIAGDDQTVAILRRELRRRIAAASR
jgi:hypothetical protein